MPARITRTLAYAVLACMASVVIVSNVHTSSGIVHGCPEDAVRLTQWDGAHVCFPADDLVIQGEPGYGSFVSDCRITSRDSIRCERERAWVRIVRG